MLRRTNRVRRADKLQLTRALFLDDVAVLIKARASTKYQRAPTWPCQAPNYVSTLPHWLLTTHCSGILRCLYRSLPFIFLSLEKKIMNHICAGVHPTLLDMCTKDNRTPFSAKSQTRPSWLANSIQANLCSTLHNIYELKLNKKCVDKLK